MSLRSPVLPLVEIDKPKSSNQDLSYISRFSASPGLLYPVNVTPLSPGDRVRFDISALVKTLPLLGPLMGSFKVQFDTYFAPVRLYNRLLHDDRTRFDPNLVLFPIFRLRVRRDTVNQNVVHGVNPSSLYHFLGIPEVFGAPAAASGSVAYRYFNAIPLIAYWDIFRGYYANTQVNYFRVMQYSGPGNQPVRTYQLENINAIRTQILTHEDSDDPYVVDMFPDSTAALDYNAEDASCGLICRTFLPDRFSAWINSDSYNNSNSVSQVSTAGNFFTLDTLRFSSHLNQMLQKTLVSGGRYSDWQKVQYGVSMRSANEVPRFLGSHSMELLFEDVIQTSSTVEDSPLGTLGGRGVGYMKSGRINYHCTEHGYMMTIMSLIPRVDYYQGVEDHMALKNMGQFHVPALDGIGFQDVLTDRLYAGSTNINDPLNPVSGSLGKQPAWIEYMTAVNRLHGDFADSDKLMYLVLARRIRSDRSSVTYPVYDGYILPQDFNYIFADSSAYSQNFWVQCNFKIHVRRVISKRVMPRL